MNNALNHLVGQLKEHASLVNAGLDSEQASNVVFHKLSNEDSQAQQRQQTERSECCMSEVGYSGINVYCTECGEFCHVADAR